MADGDLELLEDKTGGRLGRSVLWHDPENRRYPTRGVLFQEQLPVRAKAWWLPSGVTDQSLPWDQGKTSSCTAHAAAESLMASPFRMKLSRTNLVAYDLLEERISLYRESQKVDPWPGEEPKYTGSSTDAPFKVLRERGQINEWRWCFGLDDVLRTLTYHGPVALGTDWYEGMSEPLARKTNFIATVGGENEGGHAYLCYGVHVDPMWPGGGYVRCINSWGRQWGDRGRFLIDWANLETLLKAQGEAVTIVL